MRERFSGAVLRAICLVCVVFAMEAGPTVAGSSCEERTIGPEEIQKAMQMALKTRQALEASGASAAVVARVGSDISEHGLRYTHAGAVLRDHPKGKWIFVHLLNDCGSDRSGIYDEGLGACPCNRVLLDG